MEGRAEEEGHFRKRKVFASISQRFALRFDDKNTRGGYFVLFIVYKFTCLKKLFGGEIIVYDFVDNWISGLYVCVCVGFPFDDENSRRQRHKFPISSKI